MGRVTVTLKLCVALMTGVPLSETATLTVWVEGDWAMAGRQVNTPVFVLRDAPAGARGRLKVSVSGVKRSAISRESSNRPAKRSI